MAVSKNPSRTRRSGKRTVSNKLVKAFIRCSLSDKALLITLSPINNKPRLIRISAMRQSRVSGFLILKIIPTKMRLMKKYLIRNAESDRSMLESAEPMLAPIIAAVDWVRVMTPALTKPTITTVVAVED